MLNFKGRLAYNAEVRRLAQLNDPHIIVSGSELYIDHWCDGDVNAQQRVEAMTRKSNRLFVQLQRSEATA